MKKELLKRNIQICKLNSFHLTSFKYLDHTKSLTIRFIVHQKFFQKHADRTFSHAEVSSKGLSSNYLFLLFYSQTTILSFE